MRAYLDSSGKLENGYLTLAAIASTEEIWQQLEIEWDKIFGAHTPKASYVHMREIVHQNDGFDRRLGWNDDNAFGLSNKCLMYMSHLDKQRFRMFYCAIDLKAWRKLKAETYELPDPIEMCNSYCSETVLGWYFYHYPDVINPRIDTVKYFFDQNEYFKKPFEEKWIRERSRAEKSSQWSPWQMIKEVTAVDMRNAPGIQAADIVAWAVNRENLVQHGKKAKYLGHIMRQVIPSLHVVWDETKMRQHFKPALHVL